MKGQIRNIYPGGNTSKGFYSYYSYILPQKKAKKIICIKGGPGTGKSTMMKRIGTYFAEQGEPVDFMWCSSDPDSLDGIVLRKRKIALLDGTAPHIVDPVNPGAVDEIVNLGQFWDEEAIRPYREQIMQCDAAIKQNYKMTYHYLNIAGQKNQMLRDLYMAGYGTWMPDGKPLKKESRRTLPQEQVPGEEAEYEAVQEREQQTSLQADGKAGVSAGGKGILRDLRDELKMRLRSFTAIKRALNKRSREFALGVDTRYGEVQKYFAGAITPKGMLHGLDSLTASLRQVIVLESPTGFPSEQILQPCAEWLQEMGFDLELYYCPLDPEHKLEHIVIPEPGIGIITENSYHSCSIQEKTAKRMHLHGAACFDDRFDTARQLFETLEQEQHENLERAQMFLKRAKLLHDDLELCYVPAMDFSLLEQETQRLIDEIRSIGKAGK